MISLLDVQAMTVKYGSQVPGTNGAGKSTRFAPYRGRCPTPDGSRFSAPKTGGIREPAGAAYGHAARRAARFGAAAARIFRAV